MNQDRNWTSGCGLSGSATNTDAEVAHEIRTELTILTLLSGNLDLLYDLLDDDKRRQMIQSMRKHTRALNELVGTGQFDN